MNHKNERIKKLWNGEHGRGGMRSFTQIAKKCGLPDTVAGRDRVRSGLEWCQARGELNPPFAEPDAPCCEQHGTMVPDDEMGDIGIARAVTWSSDVQRHHRPRHHVRRNSAE